MKRKYTDEELSRILSEAAGRPLCRGGSPCWWDGGCINQIAFNEPNPRRAGRKWSAAADWFDGWMPLFESHVDPELLLRELEKQGWT